VDRVDNGAPGGGEVGIPERRQVRVGTVTISWLLLIAAGLLEIVWAIALKNADGFTRLWPSVIGIAAAMLSFVLLSLALKSLPVGTAYAVWVGVGAVGVAAVGMLFLNEAVSPLRLTFLALITVGIVGLRFVEN
jgi:quaternary ammonium compound-resistance protein SugE